MRKIAEAGLLHNRSPAGTLGALDAVNASDSVTFGAACWDIIGVMITVK